MKKKYEPPLVTSPDLGKAGFIPLGVTGCNYGDIGSACVNGIEPQGGPGKCGVGNQPDIPSCTSGTSAGESCLDGSDAILGCDIGTRFLGDCQRGNMPLGAICGAGSSASDCSAGTGAA